MERNTELLARKEWSVVEILIDMLPKKRGQEKQRFLSSANME